jgi:hypothetical protein
MSNVIIGIIGVILFIGLAIAGATILGSDFTTASASTKAATVTAHMHQLATGVQVLKARRGVSIPSSVGGGLGGILVNAKALEEVPVNPIVASNAYNASNALGGNDSNDMRLIFTDMGDTKKARDACFAIEEQAGNPNPTIVVDNPTKFDLRAVEAPRVGCMMDVYLANHYVAYIPV